MWANADDQGRLCGDPEEVKYAVCPNIDHITKADMPELLEDLQRNGLIKKYETPKSTAIQIIDWWEVNQKMQWAWPSDYPPPEGWKDRLRYKRGASTVVTENWPSSGERQNGAQVREETTSGESQGGAQVIAEIVSGESETGAQVKSHFVTSEEVPKERERTKEKETRETENEKRKRRGRGKRNSPEDSGEQPATAAESELMQFISSLKNWGFDKEDDLTWLREFRQDWPDFNVSLAKACRDYHSGRSPPKHKGHWKNRFREWMKHERQYEEERHGRAGEHRQRTGPDTKPYEWREAPDEPDDTT